MKRIGLAGMLLAGVMVLATTSTRAGQKADTDRSDWGTVQLRNVGDEPVPRAKRR